jgi:hypothetical protein
MLQHIPAIRAFVCNKATNVVCLALGVLGAFFAHGGVPAANNAKCFQIFEALLFTNKPDLSTQGLKPAAVVAPDRWLQPGQSVDLVPDQSSVRIGLRSSGAAAGILVLDQEDWPQQGPPAVVGASVSKFLTLLSSVRAVGFSGPVGYYGVIPIIDYWRAIGLPNSKPYQAWQAENDLFQPVADAVDVLFPSLYTFYDDQSGWTKYAIANLSEARRLARGKPIYAFIWPQYHDSNPKLGLTFIPGKFWTLQLQTLAKYADGVVIWGGWQKVWDERSEWWQATRQFMRTSTQICSSPNSPGDVQVIK